MRLDEAASATGRRAPTGRPFRLFRLFRRTYPVAYFLTRFSLLTAESRMVDSAASRAGT